MPQSPRKPVYSYHTNCLQDDMAVVPPGPGAFAVVLRSEFRIQSPYDAEVICLPAGTPLLGLAQVESLSDAVRLHLYGSSAGSDLRLGVALFLGHDPALGSDHPSADAVCADIDRWLGENTAFIFWPCRGDTAGINQEGFFAGVARSWASGAKLSPAIQ